VRVGRHMKFKHSRCKICLIVGKQTPLVVVIVVSLFALH
jgi:hypothetical protein